MAVPFLEVESKISILEMSEDGLDRVRRKLSQILASFRVKIPDGGLRFVPGFRAGFVFVGDELQWRDNVRRSFLHNVRWIPSRNFIHDGVF